MALAVAVLAYAAGGVPAPEGFGYVETTIGLAIGSAMLALCGLGPILSLATLKGPGPRILAFLALPAAVTGVVGGATGPDLLRDAAAFAPLALPLILAGIIGSPADRQRLSDLLAFGGVVIAARFLDLLGWPPRFSSSAAFDPINLAYLPNEPLVAFAAGWGIVRATGSIAEARWVATALWTCVAVVAGIALAATLQRGALAALGLTALLSGRELWQRRRNVLFALLPLAAGALMAVGHEVADVLRAFLAKTRATGTNARIDEAEAALAMALASPAALIFGQGWGIRIETPTVAGYRVLYMHVLPAFLLAKTGLIGVAAAGAAIWKAVPLIVVTMRDDPPRASALLTPILIACTLHTGYRTLGFGLLLLLIAEGVRPAGTLRAS